MRAESHVVGTGTEFTWSSAILAEKRAYPLGQKNLYLMGQKATPIYGKSFWHWLMRYRKWQAPMDR